MKTPRFFVQCMTCGSRIRFFDESRLGQIIPCPKCGGMVLVEKSPSSANSASDFTENAQEKSAKLDSTSVPPLTNPSPAPNSATSQNPPPAPVSAMPQNQTFTNDSTTVPVPPPSPPVVSRVKNVEESKSEFDSQPEPVSEFDTESEFEFEGDEKNGLRLKSLILGMFSVALVIFLSAILLWRILSPSSSPNSSLALHVPSTDSEDELETENSIKAKASENLRPNRDVAHEEHVDNPLTKDASSSKNQESSDENQSFDSGQDSFFMTNVEEKSDVAFSDMLQSSLGKKISENLDLSEDTPQETKSSADHSDLSDLSEVWNERENSQTPTESDVDSAKAPDKTENANRTENAGETGNADSAKGKENASDSVMNSPAALKFNRPTRNRVYSGEDTISILDFDGESVPQTEFPKAESPKAAIPQKTENEIAQNPNALTQSEDVFNSSRASGPQTPDDTSSDATSPSDTMKAPSEKGDAAESNASQNPKTNSSPELSVFRITPPEVEYLSARTAEALAIPLESVSIANRPVTALTQFAAQMSGERITVDWKKMEQLGVPKDTPIQLNLESTSLREALDTGLYLVNLGIISVGQNIRVVGWETAQIARRAEEIGEKPVKKTLDLEDLSATHATEASGQSGLNEIAKLIPQFVHPSLWENADGPGKLTPNTAKSRINLLQYPSVIQEVELFCDKIRRSRNMEVKNLPTLSSKLRNPLKDGTEISDTEIISRYSTSEKARQTLINCDLSDGTTMRQALTEIMRNANSKIIFDETAIARVPVSALIPDADVPDFEGRKRELPQTILDLPCVYRFEGVSMEEAVTDILKQTPLFCYPISSNVFFLTTYEESMRKMLVDFYPVGDLIKNYAAAGTLINGIQSNLYPKSWTRGGGAGAIYFDLPGKTLIVRQNPVLHYQIEMFLKRFRQTQAPSEKKTSRVPE